MSRSTGRQDALIPLIPATEMRYGVDDQGRPTVEAQVCLGDIYEGPPQCVHGGYVAALFDTLLGILPYRIARNNESAGVAGAFTGRLTVRYPSPTPLNTDLVFTGWVTDARSRRITTAGQCRANGVVTAEAQALFVRPVARPQ